MAIYKEIVTKAIIGKGKKDFKDTYTITPEIVPTTVLGCWVINHNFKGYPSNGKIVIDGSFDVNIWYSYENDTKTTVLTKNITYSESEKLSIENQNIINKDIIIRSLKQPTCTSAKEDGNTIELEIEKELGIEIIGDTKVKITSVEEEETWDILGAETEETIEKINPNYINKEIIK